MPSSGSLACCYSDSIAHANCQNLTQETWQLPLGQALVTLASAGATSSSTSTSTSISSTQSSTSIGSATQGVVTNTSQSSTDTTSDMGGVKQSISPGAKAGIGIGIAVACLLIIGIVALILVRRSKNKHQSRQPLHAERIEGHMSKGGYSVVQADSRYELAGEHGSSEMPIRKDPVEMSAVRLHP